MRSVLLLFFTLITFYNISYAQCPTGTISLNTQADVDNFATTYPDCTELLGGLFIQGASITDLSPLSGIESVAGVLKIASTSLTNLNGLNNLTSVGSYLYIDYNNQLADISELNGLDSIGSFIKITHNSSLTTINGLNNVHTTIEYIDITSNNSLQSISGFNSIAAINDYVILGKNNVLNSLIGFNAVTSVGGDFTLGYNLGGNPFLINVNMFNSLTTINGNLQIKNNTTLSNLGGFNALTTINGDILIEGNEAMSNASGLNGLTSIGNNIELKNNAFTNFMFFQNLSSITNNFKVWYNDALVNFAGLGNLNTIGGDFSVFLNESLIDFTGLENLITVGGNVHISSHDLLENLDALDGIKSIGGDLEIGNEFDGGIYYSNIMLGNVTFSNLDSINGSLYISGCGELTQLSDFNNLKKVHGLLRINANHKLENISGFNNLTYVNNTNNASNYDGISIDYNFMLSSISGFGGLIDLDGSHLFITRNNVLSDITGFQNLNNIAGTLKIDDNDLLTNLEGFGALTTIGNEFIIGIGPSASSSSNGNPALVSLHGFENLTTVAENVFINSNPSLVNLTGLSSLTTIGGNLEIKGVDGSGNSSLVNLQGMDALQLVEGDITILANSALTTLGMNSLTTVNRDFSIEYNPALENLMGLNSINAVYGNLTIQQNENLLNLSGLNSLFEAGNLFVQSNSSLQNIEGLSNLTYVRTNDIYTSSFGQFTIGFNDQLLSLNGLESLNDVELFYIYTNSMLNDISAISNIIPDSISSLGIKNNPELSICSVSSICNYLNLPNHDADISNNAIGCESEESILASCESETFLLGNVRLDTNGNGCDNEDLVVSNIPITMIGGTDDYTIFTNPQGAFKFFVDAGTYTSQLVFDENNFSVSPESHESIITTISDTFDFCLTPTTTINDLSIAIYPIIAARPGMSATYQIVYKNEGTTPLSGNIVLNFDGTKINFANANPSPNSQTSNDLTFDYLNLSPFETRIIDIDFDVATDVNLGDELFFTSVIHPIADDQTIDNNTFTFNQTVIGSFDPNDITCVEGDEILLQDVDNYLHYIIRFQNTGTASAINIVVKNTLDDQLDWTTFQLENISHPNQVVIKNENNVEFIFENINLADSTFNEPDSHGFISYKIKPKSNVALGDIILNQADIYFDFNAPVETNTASTEIIDFVATHEYPLSDLSIYPNPASTEIFVPLELLNRDYKIISLTGMIVKYGKVKGNLIDLKGMDAGIYFLEIRDVDLGKINRIKLVKE